MDLLNSTFLITLISDDGEVTICCKICGSLVSKVLDGEDEEWVRLVHKKTCELALIQGSRDYN